MLVVAVLLLRGENLCLGLRLLILPFYDRILYKLPIFDQVLYYVCQMNVILSVMIVASVELT